MADPIRIPLVASLEPRLADSSKDGLASNVFYDKTQSGTIYATKRPGITTNVTASGLASGIFGGFIFTYPDYVWEDSVWNGSRFVVVGHKETLDSNTELFLYSDDGLVWKQVNAPSAGNWQGVAWNGTVFCAIGYTGTFPSASGLCATSTDGITWTLRSFPLNIGNKIASDGSRFVAVGSPNTTTNPNVAYSTDNGVTWTTVTVLEGGNSLPYHDIAWNSTAGLFAIVGGGGEFKIQTSPTGVTWTDRTVPLVARQEITSSTTKFVAFRNDGAGAFVDTSLDGITWTTSALPATYAQSTKGAAWTGSDFIGLSGDFLRCVISPDGTTWTMLTLDSLNFDPGSTELFTVVGNGTTSAIFASHTASSLDKYWTSQDNSVSFDLVSIGIVYPKPFGEY